MSPTDADGWWQPEQVHAFMFMACQTNQTAAADIAMLLHKNNLMHFWKISKDVWGGEQNGSSVGV
jgi:hypothetical protein